MPHADCVPDVLIAMKVWALACCQFDGHQASRQVGRQARLLHDAGYHFVLEQRMADPGESPLGAHLTASVL